VKRRVFLGAAAAGWAACGASAAQHAGAVAGVSEATLRERAALLRAAEESLARCDAAGALARFERAASMLHAPDAELGIVRSHMQAGDYGRALAFCAHAATAHRDEPAAVALHAWLLNAGGQEMVARQVLARAIADGAGDSMVEAVQSELERPWPRAHRDWLRAPARFAPYATSTPQARLVATATLLPGGAIALAPAAALRSPGHVWLRNGLGTTVPARVGRNFAALGLVELLPQASLPAASPGMSAAEPFAGSAGFAVAFAPQPGGESAWPLLKAGFVGARVEGTGWQRLGIELAPGGNGGPVFDGAGRICGIAASNADAMLLATAPLLRTHVTVTLEAKHQAPARSSDVEAVYAVALAHTLQVLRAR
jgi:hypothetical protein